MKVLMVMQFDLKFKPSKTFIRKADEKDLLKDKVRNDQLKKQYDEERKSKKGLFM